MVSWPAGMEWEVSQILHEIERVIDGTIRYFYIILWANCDGLGKIMNGDLPGNIIKSLKINFNKF